MTDPAPLFRTEALRSRAEDLSHDDPAGLGPLAQVSSRWTAYAYWALLVLMASALAGSAQVRVGEFARGPAVIRGQMVVAVLPAVFASRLRAGLPLTLTLPGQARVNATVSATGPELTGVGAASTLLGTDVALAGLPPGTLLTVRAVAGRAVAGRAVAGRAVAGRAGQRAGTASVRVGSQRLITTFVTSLAPGSGAGDG
jgi:hypothetical protein